MNDTKIINNDPINNKEVSLKKRYFAKLSANLVRLALNLLMAGIIPRGLGPKAYGEFNFLTDFFTRLISFFSLNTLIGFYTKVSQRQNEKDLVIFYILFTCVVYGVLVAFVTVAHLTGLSIRIWVDQKMIFVYMAVGWIILNWTQKLLINLADAYGITVSMEIIRIIQRVISAVVAIFLFISGYLTLTVFFFLHYGIMLILIFLLAWVIIRNDYFSIRGWQCTWKKIKSYISEFYTYSHPLFVYSIFGFVTGILDRWLLQRFGGSIQQGYFGLSFQIGAACFLFTSAMTNLITREFAIAFDRKDLAELRRIFRRYIPLLYAIAAYFGCFISVQASKIALLFGGREFLNGSLPIAIMALYPIHQTYGQLSGAVYYATGQTRLYRNIGIVISTLGLLLAFFMVAPRELLGFEAGATGLAIKFVVLQFISVNIQLWFNAKFLGLRFHRYFGHQILCLVFLLLVSFSSKYIIGSIDGLHEHGLIVFLLSGVLYTIIVIIAVLCLPILFGLSRKNINNMTAILYQKVKR